MTRSTDNELRPDWRRFLASGTPQEVLVRLVDGDPLGVRARAVARLREARLVLDGERVALRCLARVARAAQFYRGRPSFETWLDERCDEALRDLVEEERLAVSRGEPVASEPNVVLRLFAEPLGLEPAAARRACVTLNERPFEERDAFFALVLEARPLDEVARERDLDPTLVARRARRVLLALLRSDEREQEMLP